MDISSLKRIGGHPALDFINTVSHWTGEGPQRNYMPDYAGLLRWSRDAGVLDAHEFRELTRRAAENPPAAARVHRGALSLRRALHDVFQAGIAGRAPDAAQIEVLNSWHGRALRRRRVLADRQGRLIPGWSFGENALPLELPLLKLVLGAVELAGEAGPGRLKECPGQPACGWLFYDASKNRSRRWCDMEDCGNIAKARRHYARVRKRRMRGRGLASNRTTSSPDSP
ncbi:MAG: CGNR zinc finger domain-containing protein [Gammaproteobacteria bacterium]